jgi:hypothetical protein
MKTNLLKLLTEAKAFVSTRACTPQGRRLASRLAAAVKADLDFVVVKDPEVPLLYDSMPRPLEVPKGWVRLKKGEKIQRHDLVPFKSLGVIEWASGGLLGHPWNDNLVPVYRHPSRF